MTSAMWLDDPSLPMVLGSGELEIEGRLRDASNTTLRCTATAPDGRTARCVYKPVAGERPLWDFPDRTLTRRELAAFEVLQRQETACIAAGHGSLQFGGRRASEDCSAFDTN